MTSVHSLRRALAAALLALAGGPVAAQDFVFEPGRPPTYASLLIDVGNTASTVVRHMTGFGGVLVMGSRYSVGAGFDRATQTERLYYHDLRTGAGGLVPGIVLEGTVEESSWIPSPRLADDLHPRVFIWHRQVAQLQSLAVEHADAGARAGRQRIRTGRGVGHAHRLGPLTATSPAATAGRRGARGLPAPA